MSALVGTMVPAVTSTCSTFGDLVHRRAAHLAHALGDAVHPVDVRLAELTAVGVDRQAAAELDVAVLDEVLRLAAPAEPELLELRERERREVVVDDRGLDVGRRRARWCCRAGARPGPSRAEPVIVSR